MGQKNDRQGVCTNRAILKECGTPPCANYNQACILTRLAQSAGPTTLKGKRLIREAEHHLGRPSTSGVAEGSRHKTPIPIHRSSTLDLAYTCSANGRNCWGISAGRGPQVMAPGARGPSGVRLYRGGPVKVESPAERALRSEMYVKAAEAVESWDPCKLSRVGSHDPPLPGLRAIVINDSIVLTQNAPRS